MEAAIPLPVYVVADSAARAAGITNLLSHDERFVSRAFTSATACRQALREALPLLVVIAADFAAAPPLIRALHEAPHGTMVLVVIPPCAIADVEPAELFEAGATALLPASAQVPDYVLRAAERLASERQAARPARVGSLSAPTAPALVLPHLWGESEAMHSVFKLIRKAAAASILVSIRGETGTGKEEVARAIHAGSASAQAPFVGLNMAAIPRELLESELFGHEKGAFTGALVSRVGYFELVGRGTLFLDEIADLDLNLQAKLLRVLQERTFTRVGGTQPRPLTARLIVATYADLLRCVRAGTFREDLYYRLVGLPILLPPLRERGTDILLLANRFLAQFCPPGAGGPCRFSAAAQARLLRHHYPGNVRELRAVVELAAVLADGDEIQADDITFPSGNRPDGAPSSDVLTTHLTLRQHMAGIVQHYLDHYHGNVVTTASHLGVGKSTLYRMIQSGEVRVHP